MTVRSGQVCVACPQSVLEMGDTGLFHDYAVLVRITGEFADIIRVVALRDARHWKKNEPGQLTLRHWALLPEL